MPRTILHRTPVVVFHPVHHQPFACHRGKEVDDNDPITTSPEFEWLFTETDVPQLLTSVSVESATAVPGQKRTTRRA